MLNAFLFAAFAQSPLILGGLIVFWFLVPTRVIGWLGGYGSGALFSAIAFQLLATAQSLAPLDKVLWILFGAAIFVALDAVVEKRFGEAAGALGIVLGSIIDGVPESVIFGIQIATGTGISTAFLTAVMVSNIPQSIAPSADLKKQGQKWWRVALMWTAVVLICAVSGAVAWIIGTLVPSDTGAKISAVASGGLLAMLTNSLIPFSYERGGLLTGLWAAAGFAVSLLQQ